MRRRGLTGRQAADHQLDHTGTAGQGNDGAAGEDSAEASFAGIHESVLNGVGLDAALDAIRQCYASLWTPRAFAYRRRLGLSDDTVACAVVLCAMVGRAGEPDAAPVAAGVAFSADPRTGRRDLIVIDAAPGLDDALVGGQVEPEGIELRIDERSLGVSARRGRASRVLTDDQALALTRIVPRVLWALGEGQDPYDVEWAYDGERFWLVQARPITRVPYVTPDPVRYLPVVWSNANLKDAVAGVPSTLGWSIIQRILRGIIYTHLQTTGYQIPEGMEAVRRLEGRAYFDLTAMHWLMFDSLGFTPAEVNVSMGGMQPETPIAGAWGWRSLPASSPFRRGVEMLLDELGHRGVYEVEIANPRWNEDPTFLLEQVRTFLDLHTGIGGRAQAATRRRAAEREVRSLPIWMRPLVSWLAARARRAAALREAGKSALVSTLQVTRMMTNELGKRMFAAGLLGRPDDIFHLAWWDIAAWAGARTGPPDPPPR